MRRRFLVSGHTDGSVQVRDPAAAGRPLAHRVLSAHPVLSLVAAERDGRPMVFMVDGSGDVRGWRLPDLVPVGPALSGHDPEAYLATALLGGRQLLVVADWDRLQVWDPVDGVPIREVSTGCAAMTVGVAAGRVVAACAGWHTGRYADTVRLVDLSSGELGAPLPGTRTDTSVTALAISATGQLLAGDHDGWVRRWDLADSRQLGRPWQAYELASCLGRPAVHALDIGTVAGRPVLVAGGWDGEIRGWDLTDATAGDRIGQPLTDDGYEPDDPDDADDADDDSALAALAFVGDRLAAGGAERVLRLWDLTTGTVVRRWRTGSATSSLVVA